VTNQVLEDAPTLRSYIDGRLTYMLLIREEEGLLRGNGSSPNLQGILTHSSRQLQPAVAGDNPATIGQAIGKIELVDGEADGLVFHPTDFWAMMTTRHANPLDGGFTDAGQPFAGPPTTVWGLNSTRSRAMTTGHVLVGAFNMGAQVFDRTGITIRVTDSHDDYFIYNKTVILAEERLAFAIHRPDFFVDATL
jgi:HK97 family phage major capsid protein